MTYRNYVHFRKKKTQKPLLLDIKTSKKASNSLFDFSKNLFDSHKVEKIPSSHSGILINVDCNSDTKKSKNSLASFGRESVDSRPEEVLKIRQENDECFIVPNDQKAKNCLWRVLNKTAKDYILQENDVVRMGNSEMKLIYVFQNKTESNVTTHYSNNSLSHSKSSSLFNICSQIDKALIGDMKENHHLQPICRLCNTDEISINNILIRPCECRSYVHLQCYKNFLKKTIVSEYVKDCMVIIENDSLICEKCQTKQILVMNFCNSKKDLLDLQYFSRYMIIEKNDGKTMIINLERYKDIFIGQTQECLIKFTDPSVSEVHCRISQNEGTLHLSDCHSKHGTSVQLQKPLFLDQEAACLLIGNSLIKIKKKDKKLWFLC